MKIEIGRGREENERRRSFSTPEKEPKRAAFRAFVGFYCVWYASAFAKAVLCALPGLSAYVCCADAHCRVPGAVGLSLFSL